MRKKNQKSPVDESSMIVVENLFRAHEPRYPFLFLLGLVFLWANGEGRTGGKKRGRGLGRRRRQGSKGCDGKNRRVDGRVETKSDVQLREKEEMICISSRESEGGRGRESERGEKPEGRRLFPQSEQHEKEGESRTSHVTRREEDDRVKASRTREDIAAWVRTKSPFSLAFLSLALVFFALLLLTAVRSFSPSLRSSFFFRTREQARRTCLPD